MNLYILSLGSNVLPQKNIPNCLDLVARQFQVLKISSLYETPPFGPSGKKPFWNLVLVMTSQFSSKKVRAELRKIERQLGRKRTQNRFAARTIDIDLLPYPDFEKHPFVMIPLQEIASNLQMENGRTIKKLEEKTKNQTGFKIIATGKTLLKNLVGN